jgi:DNA-directed RNA polymerase specialized sigma subunit
MVETRTEKEKDLWKKYRAGDKKALEELMHSLAPLIERSVSQWSGSSIPSYILRARATNLVKEALDDWNPSLSQMNTHIINRLQKLSRLVYEHQNVARIPESRAAKIGAFQAGVGDLTDTLKREPSTAEIADHLSWDVKEVARLQKEMRKEIPSSMLIGETIPFGEDTKEKHLLDYYYAGLNPINQTIFENITGYGNKQVLTDRQIANRVKIPVAEVQAKKQEFIGQLKEWKVMM